MTEEKRTNEKPITEDLEKVLNRKQKAKLHAIQHLGWGLKFVRKPLFLEAVPVVYNARYDQIGILDPDGNISLDLEIDVRSSDLEQEQQPSEAASWKEKRKDIAPVPENLDGLLNQHQMRALRQAEAFGWQLHFVRQPLFQEPVPGIINLDGDMLATLERDGRINLMPDSTVRKEVSDEKTDPAQPSAASVGSSKVPRTGN